MSVTQTEPPENPSRAVPTSADPLGVPSLDTHLALQTDCVKELVNKLSWVLGSTYRVPYANMRTDARQYAWRIVKRVIEDNGYPSKIAK